MSPSGEISQGRTPFDQFAASIIYASEKLAASAVDIAAAPVEKA